VKRWIVLVALFCAACGREERETTTMPANPPPVRTSSAVSPAPAGSLSVPAPPRGPNRSTPQKCAGDGSYEQALDCFRMSSGFHFVLPDAKGELTRPTPGMERVQFKAGDGATWTGEAKRSGVVWSRDGKHEQSPPDITNRVWQRTTMVLDPQKKEGRAQLVGAETVGSEPANHYHFTNANNGEANDVWVSTRDGRIVKWKAGASALELR
jgi:hypothetical protein